MLHFHMFNLFYSLTKYSSHFICCAIELHKITTFSSNYFGMLKWYFIQTLLKMHLMIVFQFFFKHIVEESRLGSIYAGKGIVVLGPTSRCYLTLRVPPSVCFASDSSIYSLLCSSSIPVLVPFLRVLLLALYI